MKTYTGEALAVQGSMRVRVRRNQQDTKLMLLVVKNDGPNLLGRDWLQHLRLDWQEIHRIQTNALDKVLQKHQEVFKEGLGTLKGCTAKIHINPGATPRFCKAPSVPYSMQALVDKELDRLLEEGVIEPVQFADWAAPIIPVLKSDKASVRICGDFKLTINQASKLDWYPIPRIEDLFAKLAGGKTSPS